MIHDLKIWPQYFICIIEGSKTFEIRKNDRDFNIGDKMILREWVPGAFDGAGHYTGRTITCTVTYIIFECAGLIPGYVIMSIDVLKPLVGKRRKERIF